MFCPNCGGTNSDEQRFCRSCGLSLEKIAQSVAEQLPAKEINKRTTERQRLVERLLQIVGGSAVSIAVGAVLWGIIYEIIIVKGEVLAGSIFLAFVVGLILFALLAVYRDSLAKASSKRQLASANVLSSEKHTAAGLPQSPSQLISSVTERTTELIDARKQERKKTGEPAKEGSDDY